MIRLGKGVTVYAGGREWKGEIPDHLCPDHLKPVPAPAAPVAKRSRTQRKRGKQ